MAESDLRYPKVLAGRPKDVDDMAAHASPLKKAAQEPLIAVRSNSPTSMGPNHPDDPILSFISSPHAPPHHPSTYLDSRHESPQKSIKKRPAGSDEPSPPHVSRPYSPKNPRRASPDALPRTPTTSAAQRAMSPFNNGPARRSPHARHHSAAHAHLPSAGHQFLLPQRQKPSQSPAIGADRTVLDVLKSRGSHDFLDDEDDEEASAPSPLIKQPECRPISQQQLAAEVKGIYSGLVMVETKCIAIINQQTNALRTAERDGRSASQAQHIDQFQALIALHRTLLHEHHDFLLASQHPSANQAIKDLASRYSMPARMWKHGIHNFLELLRARLPDSLEYMLAFIYLAYQMMALLYDTVPSFEETWIECLGDLARYRMAIEDEDLRDRDIWTGVARFWYLKAVDKNANVGRLNHHLAILARNNPVQQLSSYCRALTANQPFLSTRDSILTLFEPSLNRWRDPHSRTISVDTWFVLTHAVTFLREPVDQLHAARSKFLSQLNDHISRVTSRWKENGACTAIANIAGILKYGCTDSKIRRLLAPREKLQSQQQVLEPQRDADSPDPDSLSDSSSRMPNEWYLATETLSVCLARTGDPNVLPHIHILLVFFWSLASTPQGAALTAFYAPWSRLADFLNALITNFRMATLPGTDAFPRPEKQSDCKPLSEDYLIHGQVFANAYFPGNWFDSASADLDERAMETAATPNHRAHRAVWIARRLAERRPDGSSSADGQWLAFDNAALRFYVDARQAQVQLNDWHPRRSAEATHGPAEHGEEMAGIE